MTGLPLWSLTASFGESESHTHGHANGTARSDGRIDSSEEVSSSRTPSFLFDDSDEESDASKADVGLGK
jgi:hypothetical protein